MASDDKGTLYICGTPIGNLEDITLRQLNTFKLADFIACEDTRHTIKILSHYGISKKLISYHEHNYKSKGPELARLLNEGNNIALVSDAGMPCICDPGVHMVKLCKESGINVTAVPGATAFATAYSLSGINSKGFVFAGFFPRDKKEQKDAVKNIETSSLPIIFYEAPHRLVKTLNILKNEIDNSRNVTVIRELTKIHEEVKSGSVSEVFDYYSENEPKGEIVLIIEGINIEALEEAKRTNFLEMKLNDHMDIYLSQGLDSKEAMKKVAKDRGISKRDVYNELLDK